MKKAMSILKKSASVVLTLALVLPVAGFAKTSVAAEEDAATKLLKEFAAKQTFLGADATTTYDGLLEKTADENYPYDYTVKNVPLDPIGYRIDDFDSDGTNELLIVGQTEKTIDNRIKHIAELVMYEVVDSAVVEKDKINLTTYEEEDGQFFQNGLIWSEGDSAWFTYVQEGKRYIAAEEYNVVNYVGDGVGWSMFRLGYDGTRFTDEGKFNINGSDLVYSETQYFVAMELFENVGISVDPKKTLNDKFRIRDYIPHKVVFASTEVRDANIDYSEIEKMKVGDALKAATISFSMGNTVVAETDDLADNGAPAFDKLIPGKITLKSVTAKKGKLIIKWKKSAAAYGYQIQVNGKKYEAQPYNGVLKIDAKKGKKYKVKVRAYARLKGKNHYGKWSAQKTVKAK